MMGLLWPWIIALFALTPLVLWLYRRALTPPSKSNLYFGDLALVERAGAEGGALRRHLPALSYLGACALALLALARPTWPIPEVHPQAGIVLALDVSRSMLARDITPNRFEAAREALKALIEDLPAGTRVGLVTFAGYATLVSPLTDDHQRLLRSVDLLRTDFGTVIGDALLTSTSAFANVEVRQALGDPQDFATIILLSDGRNFGGVHPLTALAEVKRQRVTVHTIGVGSTGNGPIPGIPPQYQFAARFDEKTLRTVAEETGGSFVFVDSARELQNIYRDLGRALAWRTRQVEISALGALTAAIILLFSLGLAEARRQVI
ncbi:MAG: VWA domain-containing protein [Trueperaceae bacterium]|nr:MAG: VWA domain-containing protein [Trueperaceae bacterium]